MTLRYYIKFLPKICKTDIFFVFPMLSWPRQPSWIRMAPKVKSDLPLEMTLRCSIRHCWWDEIIKHIKCMFTVSVSPSCMLLKYTIFGHYLRIVLGSNLASSHLLFLIPLLSRNWVEELASACSVALTPNFASIFIAPAPVLVKFC